MKNPKVDTKNRIVCAYNKSMNMYNFHKITKKGLVSSVKLPSVIADSFGEAVDRANGLSPSAKIKKTVFKMVVVDISKYKTWNDYIIASWNK